MSEDCMPFEMAPALWEPSPAQVRQTRAWLAEHPGADDAAAVAEVCRRWPMLAEWEAEWVLEEARGGAPAPAPRPAPGLTPQADPLPRLEPAALPEGVTTKMSKARRERVKGQAPPRPRAVSDTPRPSRATGRARSLPGAAEATPEAIAGVPRWEGHPVRASRIPRHLLPDVLRAIAPGARWLLWRCAQPRVSGQPLTMERLMQEAGVTRKTVQDWLAAVRGAGLMLTAHESPDRAVRSRDLRPWAGNRGPRPVDYSRLLTDSGRAVVAQLPAVVAPVVGRAREDEADMGVLAVLLRRARQHVACGLQVEGMRTTELRQLVEDAGRACGRLEVSGAIVVDWECRGRRIRLAPEVARAWGVGC